MNDVGAESDRTVPGPQSSVGTRRRGADLEAALLQAAWNELLAVGYEDFTLHGVAALAQTSRLVLARRTDPSGLRGRPESVAGVHFQQVAGAARTKSAGRERQ